MDAVRHDVVGYYSMCAWSFSPLHSVYDLYTLCSSITTKVLIVRAITLPKTASKREQ